MCAVNRQSHWMSGRPFNSSAGRGGAPSPSDRRVSEVPHSFHIESLLMYRFELVRASCICMGGMTCADFQTISGHGSQVKYLLLRPVDACCLKYFTAEQGSLVKFYFVACFSLFSWRRASPTQIGWTWGSS
jgi:hypothetical protein